MRICKTFTFLSIFIVLFYNCSLPADDEDEGNPEEDNTTSELPWEGETDKFTINSKEGLRLNDPQENAGTAYVTIPSSSVKNTRWEFGVRLTFNPSANNYAQRPPAGPGEQAGSCPLPQGQSRNPLLRGLPGRSPAR